MTNLHLCIISLFTVFGIFELFAPPQKGSRNNFAFQNPSDSESVVKRQRTPQHAPQIADLQITPNMSLAEKMAIIRARNGIKDPNEVAQKFSDQQVQPQRPQQQPAQIEEDGPLSLDTPDRSAGAFERMADFFNRSSKQSPQARVTKRNAPGIPTSEPLTSPRSTALDSTDSTDYQMPRPATPGMPGKSDWSAEDAAWNDIQAQQREESAQGRKVFNPEDPEGAFEYINSLRPPDSPTSSDPWTDSRLRFGQ